MSDRALRHRSPRLLLLAACLLFTSASAALAHEIGSAAPSAAAAPIASPAASPPAASLAPASPTALYPALPAQVAVIPADIPTVSITPESAAGMLVVGTPIEHSLQHCGLWSPVDVDGSLWQPIGGREASGAAITSDEAIGDLINATPGRFVLITPDSAEFHTLTGTVVAFARAPGALDYPLCM